MLRKLSSQINSAVSSLSSSPAPRLLPEHHSEGRAEAYVKFAEALKEAHIPADESDCASCNHPCPVQEDGTGAGSIAESGQIWDGKAYDEYVMDKYGDLGDLPKGHDCDWDSELAGSGQPARGRVVVISTGKSNWERDHTVSIDWISGSTSHMYSGRKRRLRIPAQQISRVSTSKQVWQRP